MYAALRCPNCKGPIERVTKRHHTHGNYVAVYQDEMWCTWALKEDPTCTWHMDTTAYLLGIINMLTKKSV